MRSRNHSGDISFSKQQAATPQYKSTFISLAPKTDKLAQKQKQAAIDAKKEAAREARRIKTEEANRLERLRIEKNIANEKAKKEALDRATAENARKAREANEQKLADEHKIAQEKRMKEWGPVRQMKRPQLLQLLHPEVTQAQAQQTTVQVNENKSAQSTGLYFFPRPSRENAVARPAQSTGCCAGFIAVLKSCWAKLFSCGTPSRAVVRNETAQVSPVQSRVAGPGPIRNVMD